MKLPVGAAPVLVGWLVLVALAVPGMPSWKRGLLEAVIILTVLLAVASSREVRSLVADIPKRQVTWLVALLSAWFFAQVRLLPSAGFPIVSWYMYADPRHSADIVAYRLRATPCDGAVRVVGIKEPLGGVGVRGNRLGQMHAETERASARGETSSSAALLDSTMRAMLRGHNRRRPEDRWCRLDLDRVRMAVADIGSSMRPHFEVIRHATAD